EAGDEEDRIPADIFELCRWASKYYAQPLGELLAAACPPASIGLRSAKREAKELFRNSVAQREIHLNDEQKAALEGLDDVRKAKGTSATASATAKVALLHGVTGSGK